MADKVPERDGATMAGLSPEILIVVGLMLPWGVLAVACRVEACCSQFTITRHIATSLVFGLMAAGVLALRGRKRN